MFTPVLLAGFLHSVTSRGPTAAEGVFGHLDFLQRHAKLRLPLDSAIVVRYKSGAVGHIAMQQNPLSLATYGAMVDVLRSDASLWQNKKRVAALGLRLLTSCLRLGHTARATKQDDTCTPRTCVWRISRGKGSSRAAYEIATPTHVADELNFEQHLTGAPSNWLLPDIRVGKDGLAGACDWTSYHMSNHKVLDIVAHLTSGLHDKKLSGYALRRFLPTAAHSLGLPIERRKDLGNGAMWWERKEPRHGVWPSQCL